MSITTYIDIDSMYTISCILSYNETGMEVDT